MTDRPIIFSGSMVRALLAGTKTQTRRLVPVKRYARYLKGYSGTGRLREAHPGCHGLEFVHDTLGLWDPEANPAGRSAWIVPIAWRAGDRLWVREAWTHDGPDLETVRARFEDALGGAGYGPYYRATETAPDTLSWRSPIHMPRWASRLTLTVTEVRVQRLADISETDARAEGVEPIIDHGVGRDDRHIIAFENLWGRLHGEMAWRLNPWVAAISFTATPANIDSPEANR